MQNSEQLQNVYDSLKESGGVYSTCCQMILREKAILYVCENSPCDPITARMALASFGSLTVSDKFPALITGIEDVLCYYSSIGMSEPILIKSLGDADEFIKLYEQIPADKKR